MQEQDPQAPELLKRSDPTAIIAGAALGLQTLDFALTHFGKHNTPPPQDPEPPQIILPPGTDRE